VAGHCALDKPNGGCLVSHSVVTKLRKRIFKKKLGVSKTAAAIRMWEELRGGGRSTTTGPTG
jgi:hypothetical protein